ncbi:MAG: 50S ribosomal protein L11 methyltransferase [Oscillospiraceae bacterium]|nr:50S ribosomal protein L11 methyltransferase [Oscillospiraceae bacterium]MBQ9938033.1 50S ribosomal protein L11 methyltransferase [Oscillospiraceae bacterium]
MDWLEIKITTTSEGIELVTGVLLQLGINGFVVEDPNDFESFLTDPNIYKDYVDETLYALRDVQPSVTVYLPTNEQGADMLSAIQTEMAQLRTAGAEQLGIDAGSLEITLGNVREEDWENCWKKYFKPLKVGEKFMIKPTWEQLDEPTDRIILEIDPSSSFGTGSHETTKLCIETLESTVTPECTLLDMGCGSGILGIAAYLLGATDITAVDIDANSVRIATENFERIGTTADVKLLCGNVLADTDAANELRAKLAEKKYDVIVANIVADIILAMKDLFASLLKDDGRLILSGIISERAEEVANGMVEAGFEAITIRERGGWTAILEKKTDK